MRQRKKWVILLCVVVFLILFAPLPSHLNKTMNGKIYTKNGKQNEEAIIKIKGWTYRFLLFHDRCSYTVTVTTKTDKQVFICHDRINTLSEKWDCVSIEPIYDERINGYVAGGYLLLSDLLNEICIIDSAASDFIDTIIIGSEDSSGDIDMLLETIP